MEIVYQVCCGLDVHKKSVTACLRSSGPKGKRKKETRTFRTTTSALLELSTWLSEAGCTHVAMESTGVYWRPVWNVLEGAFTLLLVNARHVKMVPGRKTDVKDSEWIAELLEHGLLRSSFVPPPPIRELRELTRYRKQLIQERAREANRVHKVLETANIKLGCVATDILGVSGTAMIKALIAGERDGEHLAQFARRALRDKHEELRDALTGRFTQHHAFMLEQLMHHIEFLERQITEFDQRIAEAMHPFDEKLERLDRIVGVGRRGAEQIVAELGVDMNQFPTAAHAASWTGLCPGNNESAGKRKSGKTTHGNRWLREALVECARGAAFKKDSYFRAQYHRLAKRRGDKKAIVAVAHSILVAAYHILKRGTEYQDAGHGYFDQIDRERLTRYHQHRLAQLGFEVTLRPVSEVA